MRFFTASALALALSIPSAAAAAQKETETIDRTVSIGQNGRLKLKNFSGDVRITGTSGGDVVVHAVRRATRERLDNIKLDITQSGSTVAIEANRRGAGWRDEKNNVVETDFEIAVPYGTALDIDAFSSRIEVRGVTGPIDAHTFSGNISIDVASAPRVPDLTAETFSGNIEARVPASASATVRFNSFSGDVDSDLPLSVTRAHRRRGDMDAQIGDGSGATLRFKTFSGDLRISR